MNRVMSAIKKFMLIDVFAARERFVALNMYVFYQISRILCHDFIIFDFLLSFL